MRARIVWSTTLVTIVAVALMASVVVVIVARVTAARIDGSLHDRVVTTRAALTLTRDGSLRVRTRADDVVDSVWVFQADGAEASGPDAGRHVEDLVTRLGGVDRSTRVQALGRVYLAEPVVLGRRSRPSGVVVVSESLEPFQGTENVLIGGLVLLGVLVAGTAAAITAWTVKRTLDPVRRMTEAAATWSRHDLDTRFGLDRGRQDEFTRLGTTLDLLLDRVAEAIRNEQQLTAELAHELRTPLTTVRAEVELGLMSGVDRPVHDRLERILVQVDRLTTTIATLLSLARHQHGAARRCDVESVVGGLVDSHPGAVPIAVAVLADGGPAVVEAAADGDLLERALAPVLDNAVRYARTAVRIDIRRDARSVVVDVCDDGAGIGDAEQAFRAGNADPDSPGAGLGLPLARRVAAGLGGSVEVTSRVDPTVVRITVPRR